MSGRYRYHVLAIAVAANFSQFGARLAISPVVPDVMAEYAVSKSVVGLLLTGMWAAFALLQYPSGVLADRYGERRVILVALALTAAFSLLLAVAPTFAAFGAAVILLGAGTGLYFAVGTTLLADLFERRGQALGIHSAGGSMAGLVVPPVVAAVAIRLGWQRAFLVTAVGAAVTLALVARVIRPRHPARPDAPVRDQFRPRTVLSRLARRRVAVTLAIAVVGMFAFQSFLSFFPTFLVEHWGYSSGRASLAFAAAFLLSAASLPTQGRLSDRFPRDAVLAGGMLLAAVGFALVVTASPPVGTLGVAAVGAGMGWGGVVQSRFMDAFSEVDRGTGFGLVRTVYLFLGAAGNGVTGVLADVAGWSVAYGAVAGLLVVAVAVLAADRALD